MDKLWRSFFPSAAMRRITPAEVPADHPYYRVSSPAYRKYLRTCGPFTIDAPGGGYGWIKRLIGKLSIAKFERLAGVPDDAALKAAGFGFGMVLWIPGHTDKVPAGWRRLWVPTHMTDTGYCVLEGPDYAKKWNQRARRALKKFRAVPDARVVEMAPEDFERAFQATRVRHPFKGDYVRYYRKLVAADPSAVRSWGVEYRGKIVAGLAVHDYAGTSTVHLVAFTGRDAKPIQAGTALIDRWFADSLARGLRYANFDHLRGIGMTPDQQGYTDFKNNFIEYAVRYRQSYFKWVR